MARKERPNIKGTDPAYASEFEPIPTNKPVIAASPAPAATQSVPEPDKAPKPDTTAKPEKSRANPITPKPTLTPNPKPQSSGTSQKREIALSAAVKLDQQEQLAALEAKGTPTKVAITMAGRRAIEQFEPKQEFVEKLDIQRMPMRQGYKSTKRIDAALLDTLRDKHDPHRLSSDGAMMRGQFEPLFWSCLDAVIEELNSKD